MIDTADFWFLKEVIRSHPIWSNLNPKFIDFTGFDEEEIRKTRLDYENKNIDIDKVKYAFRFEYSDITYIFAQQQEDIDRVIEEIRNVKIDQMQQDRLIAKIITSRQIERDF